jgi:uncharacterized protein (DUF488 family)
MTELFTIGYNKWKSKERIERLLEALSESGVTLLVDVRHSPCSPNTSLNAQYGPKDVNLQANGQGLAAHLRAAGIEYRWLVELGNPQKNDPEMLILREHLADMEGNWPVQRGLRLLEELVRTPDARVALLCACKEYDKCHRTLVADAFVRIMPDVTICHL